MEQRNILDLDAETRILCRGSVDDAIQQYEAMLGHLTLFSPFSKDLLAECLPGFCYHLPLQLSHLNMATTSECNVQAGPSSLSFYTMVSVIVNLAGNGHTTNGSSGSE